MALSVRKLLTCIRNLLLLASILAIMLVFVACDAKGVQESTTSNAFISTATEPVDIQSTTPLDTLELSLPKRGELRRDSENQETFVINGTEVGGVFLLDVDSKIFDDVLNHQESVPPLVLAAMKDLGNPEWEWYMSSSSLYGLLEINMGYSQEEYMAYVVRGYAACYIVWFNRNQISSDDEISIMQSLSSSDISDELNMVSNQAYADAIAESMAQEEYRLDITLPEGLCTKDETEDGALFYQNGQLVGGYKVIHFEKGILSNVDENHDMILECLREYLADQVNLTNFSGEIIIEEGLITAQFSDGEIEYTHYILSYGQIGTQYDIWFDESKIDQNSVKNIIYGAQLTSISR